MESWGRAAVYAWDRAKRRFALSFVVSEVCGGGKVGSLCWDAAEVPGKL
jgi:hypothetical protein